MVFLLFIPFLSHFYPIFILPTQFSEQVHQIAHEPVAPQSLEPSTHPLRMSVREVTSTQELLHPGTASGPPGRPIPTILESLP